MTEKILYKIIALNENHRAEEEVDSSWVKLLHCPELSNPKTNMLFRTPFTTKDGKYVMEESEVDNWLKKKPHYKAEDLLPDLELKFLSHTYKESAADTVSKTIEELKKIKKSPLIDALEDLQKAFTKKRISQEEVENRLIKIFSCPITLELLEEPLSTKDGHHSFEKEAIKEWLLTNSTNPVNRKQLNLNDLKEYPILKSYCDAFKRYLELGSSVEILERVNNDLEKRDRLLQSLESIQRDYCIRDKIKFGLVSINTLKHHLIEIKLKLISEIIEKLSSCREEKFTEIFQKEEDKYGERRFETVNYKYIFSTKLNVLKDDLEFYKASIPESSLANTQSDNNNHENSSLFNASLLESFLDPLIEKSKSADLKSSQHPVFEWLYEQHSDDTCGNNLEDYKDLEDLLYTIYSTMLEIKYGEKIISDKLLATSLKAELESHKIKLSDVTGIKRLIGSQLEAGEIILINQGQNNSLVFRANSTDSKKSLFYINHKNKDLSIKKAIRMLEKE